MKSFYKVFFVGISVLFFSTKLSAQKNTIPALDINKIEKEIDSLLSKYSKEAPGVSIGVINNNKLVLQKNIGLANLDHQIPITNSTSFHVASVSKQFTAFAILQLEDQGKLSVEDDIRKYLPEMHQFKNKIKIKDLLNHTSGLKDQWNLLRLSGWRLNDFIDQDQVLKILFNQTSLNFQPNEQFMYSNSGYTLLAEIVSRVSNMSFAEYAKKHIFIPLKMYNTVFVDKEGQIRKNKSLSYYRKDSEFIEDVFNNVSVGATNLSTTIEDLSKWAINFSTQKVGSPNIFKKIERQEKLTNGSFYGYANGQFIDDYEGIKRIAHSGQDASYQAYLARFPEVNIGLVFTNNNSEINGGQMVGELLDICLKKYFKKKKRKPLKKLLTHEKPITRKLKELKRFEGFYWNEKDRYSREIRVVNNVLQYIRSATDTSALVPVGINKFEMKLEEYVGVWFKNVNKMVVTLDDGYQIFLDKYIPANYNSEMLKECKGVYYSSELNAYYSVLEKENAIVINHTRLGDFKLKAIKKDYFVGNKGSFRKVVFVRNKLGKVTGFKVSSSRAKNVLFKKLMNNY